MYSSARPLRRLPVRASLLLPRALSPPSGLPSLCHCSESLGKAERPRESRSRPEKRGQDLKNPTAVGFVFVCVFARLGGLPTYSSTPPPPVNALFRVASPGFHHPTCKMVSGPGSFSPLSSGQAWAVGSNNVAFHMTLFRRGDEETRCQPTFRSRARARPRPYRPGG